MINGPGSASRSLRVMTYNIHGLHDDAAAVTEVLRAAEPDVVAIQEPPRGPLGRRRLRAVAEAAGLEVAVQGGGARTTALLVRARIQVTGRRAISLTWRGRTRRGMALADVAGVRVISLHLGLSAAERARHAGRLHAVITSAPAGLVVAGDFNEPPGGPVRRRLGLHLRDLTPGTGPTFPADRPTQRIDAVLGSGGLVPSGARAVDTEAARRASDHLPVVVHLRW